MYSNTVNVGIRYDNSDITPLNSIQIFYHKNTETPGQAYYEVSIVNMVGKWLCYTGAAL